MRLPGCRTGQAHSAQARGGRQATFLRQLHIGQAAIALQGGEDAAVEIVEFHEFGISWRQWRKTLTHETGAGGVAGQFVLLGTLLGLAFDGFYAMVGAALGHWIARRPCVQWVQRWTFAGLLIGVGLRLALVARPQ